MRSLSAEYSPYYPWVNLGSITASSTALAVTGRDYATAEATGATKVKLLQWGITVDTAPKAMLLRFRTDGVNDSTNVLDILACRGNDDYHRIATLTITEGQQKDSGSIYFCDTITPANEDGLFDGEESNLADYIAHYYVRTLGFNKFLFQVTTLNNTTVYIDYVPIFE